MKQKLRKNDLITINNALNEILHGPDSIEEWEFQTRVGITKEEARKTLLKIKKLLDIDNPAPGGIL